MIKILIVEDDKLLLNTLKFDLESDGFKVITANSYKEGLEISRGNNFDIALLDINLPDGDGFSICKAIKARFSTPVIFLTARDQEVDEIKGFDLGADDYITLSLKTTDFIWSKTI